MSIICYHEAGAIQFNFITLVLQLPTMVERSTVNAERATKQNKEVL